MRVLVIGDIHGAHKALLQVLERSKFDPTKDKLITLGDYVDGWSESPQVVEELLEIESLSSEETRPIFIKGNHDQWWEEYLKTGVKEYWKVNQGQASTIDSYEKSGIKGVHLKFFRNLHNYYVDDQNRGFVHGGYVSRKGLGHEHTQSNYYWDRDLWGLALASHGRVHFSNVITDDSGKEHLFVPAVSRRFENHKEIFIGHTATTLYKIKPHYKEFTDPNQKENGPITVPMNRCNVWNLDTGAGWYGRLTIMDIDTKEYWQSDLVDELYPNEKGRR